MGSRRAVGGRGAAGSQYRRYRRGRSRVAARWGRGRRAGRQARRGGVAVAIAVGSRRAGRRARDVPARLWRREPPMTTRAARAARAPPAVIRAGEGSLRTDDQREDAREGRRPATGQEHFTSARADEARALRASVRPHAGRTPSVSVAARGRERGEPEKADTSRRIVSVRVFLVGRESDVRAMVMSCYKKGTGRTPRGRERRGMGRDGQIGLAGR